MSETIFFVCWISWISRCSLAASSFFQTESRVPCQREGKKVLREKFRRWRNRDLWSWWWRSRDLWIWCRTASWVGGRILRKIRAVPTTRWMPKRNKAVFQPASGNRCETRTIIQPCFLKRGNKKALNMQIRGNKKWEVVLRTQPASGNTHEDVKDGVS